jgi:hypothetical protein
MGNAYYENKIKVVCEDMMCFPVNPITLEATAISCYDPWAWSDPETSPMETITHAEWLNRSRALQEG